MILCVGGRIGVMSNGPKYVCTVCGRGYPKQPIGGCRQCGGEDTVHLTSEMNTQEKAKSGRSGLKSSVAVKPSSRAQTLTSIRATPVDRVVTGISELDRVLGGGFVEGEVILLSGAPGAGKSTLTLRVADMLANQGMRVLYTSGEESEQQIGLRAARMNVTSDQIRVVSETNLETVLGHVEGENPDVLIVDSLQTVASSEISGSVGSVQQSKEAAHTLTRTAKQKGIIAILISQVVKSGDFSGSESIQHIVDATIMLESSPDTPLKFLRATKNRFGDTTEVGVFQHSETGLEEVKDPSGVLMGDQDEKIVSGTSLTFTSEGIRQIPVEVQALVSNSNLPTPRRQFNGIQFNRGQIVCAILDKFCRAGLYDRDVFINTVSGIKVNDPLADLSIAAAVLSSIHGTVLGERVAFVGELSLTGQVRGTHMIEAKVREAARMGFDTIVIPKSAAKTIRHKGIKIRGVSLVYEIQEMFKNQR